MDAGQARMGIDPTGFLPSHHQPLFDLLILAIYADGHLTTFEDKQLQGLLAVMGFTEETDRRREFDAGVARIQPFVQSVHEAKNQALLLTEAFTTRPQQYRVLEVVEQVMTRDNHISSWENTLLMELRMKFRL